MPATHRLITAKPTPGCVAPKWVMPWEVGSTELDPVTTESERTRWRSQPKGKSIDATIRRPLARSGGQGEDIVCAAGNSGMTRDVGSSHPGAGVGPKGWAVRPLKRYASWVQNVVRQFGPYPPWALGA
jgi:hypothetical protein